MLLFADIHSRTPVIEQRVILVPHRKLNAIFFLPLRLPPPAPQTPPQQTVKQWLDAVNRSVFNQQKSPCLPTLPSASLQHTLLLSTARPFIQSRYAAITMNTPPASSATLASEQPPAPQPRAINFATEWLDEDGRVCPKNVDYATQCPKGHALVPLDGGGGAQAQEASGADVMCRVCHASTPRQQTMALCREAP